MKISLINAGKRFNRDWIFRNIHQEFISGLAYAITGPNGSGKSTLLQVIGGAMMASEGEAKYVIGSRETADGKRETANVKRQTADGRRETADVKRQTTDGNRQSAIGNAQKADGRRQTADANRQTANGKRETAIGKQNSEAEDHAKEIQVDQAFQYIAIAAPYLELIEEMTLLEFLEFHKQFKPFLPSFDIPGIITEIGLKTAAGKQIRFYSSGMKQRVKLAQAIFSDVPCVLLDEPCTNLDTAGIELYHQLIRNYCTNRLVIVSSNDEQEYAFCKEILSISDYKK